MAYFDGAGQRFYPFGRGSGERICAEFGLPNLTRLPIVSELSAAGDSAPWDGSCPGCLAQAQLALCSALVFWPAIVHLLLAAARLSEQEVLKCLSGTSGLHCLQ